MGKRIEQITSGKDYFHIGFEIQRFNWSSYISGKIRVNQYFYQILLRQSDLKDFIKFWAKFWEREIVNWV